MNRHVTWHPTRDGFGTVVDRDGTILVNGITWADAIVRWPAIVAEEALPIVVDTCPTCGGEGYVGGLVIADDMPTVDEICYRCRGRGVVPSGS